MKKILFALLLLFPRLAHACSVCFGGSDSNWTRGFMWGVIVLGVLPFILMAGLVAVIARTAKKNAGAPQ